MRASAISLVIVALAGSVYAADSTEVFVSVYANKDEKVSAKPDTSFWKGVKGISIVNDYFGQPIPGYHSEVRSRWTKDNLYLLYVSSYQQLTLKPDPETEKETNQLWNFDVAEAFIGWDPEQIGRYREFEVSPHAEWVDLNIDRTAPRGTGQAGWMWNSGWKVAAQIDEKKHLWYAEMVIPWSAFSSNPPTAGTEMRANFFLSAGPSTDKKNLAWRKTDKKSFHVPEVFGKLRLEKK